MRYKITLQSNEKQEFERILKKGKLKAREYTRIRVILLASEGYSNSEIAKALMIPRSRVIRIKKKYVLEHTIKHTFKATKKPTFDEAAATLIIEMIKKGPPKGRVRWTLVSLTKEICNKKIVGKVSRETVRKLLKKKDFFT